MSINIGIDLGGTKILAEAIDERGEVVASLRAATPRDDYQGTINVIVQLIEEMEARLAAELPVGIGMPGSLSPETGRVQNANSVWLNGRFFKEDMTAALGRPVRFANDANCFALSEAVDGAAAEAGSSFGVIMGTGVGGGAVIGGKIIDGPRSIGGEWGHCALPFPTDDELLSAHVCWCGQKGCLESWISGPGLVAHYNQTADSPVTRVEEITALAAEGAPLAQAALNAHAHRTARGLSMVVNLFDPDMIVLGGGLSELGHLYEELPKLMAPYIFADNQQIEIRRPRFGATSGVRGAARLWPYHSEEVV